MRINEFINNFTLHDSLLESIKLTDEKLILEIELCNWRQKNYNQSEDEMYYIQVIFSNVDKYFMDSRGKKIDSDTILEVCSSVKKGDICKIKIVVEGDDDIKVIEFESDDVEVRNKYELNLLED